MRLASRIAAVGVAVMCGAGAAWPQEQPPQEQEQQKQIISVGASSLLSASVGAGARALGMGGAFIAVADDGTAAAWNPAGLSVLDKPEGSIVWSPSFKLRTYYPSSTTRTESVSLFNGEIDSVRRQELFADPSVVTQSGNEIDFASATYSFRVRGVKVVPQLSFQRAVPLGLDSSARETRRLVSFFVFRQTDPPTFEGSSFTSEEAHETVSTVRGGVDVYALSVGLGLNARASVGVSLNVWRGRIHGPLRTSQGFLDASFASTDVVESDLDDRYRGFNAAVGALFRPSDRWRVGLVYKSPFSMHRTVSLRSQEFTEFEGERSRTRRLRHVTEDGTIAWPETLGAGVAFLPVQALTLSADVTRSGWRTASYQFASRTQIDERRFDGTSDSSTLEGVVLTKFPSLYIGSEDLVDDRFDQVDTRQVRFGAEYVVRGVTFAGLKVIPLRAGLFFEQPSVKDTLRNEPVRLRGVTAGAGLAWSHLSVDVAYIRVSGRFSSRDHHTEVSSGFGSFVSRTVDEVRSDGEDRFSSHRFVISAIIKP